LSAIKDLPVHRDPKEMKETRDLLGHRGPPDPLDRREAEEWMGLLEWRDIEE
jgi:hypothetical protein